MAEHRPDNPGIENENLRPAKAGGPPRPATEPLGSKDSQDSGETAEDPGSGEQPDMSPA